MFEKLLSVLFFKTEPKSIVTVISAKREKPKEFGALKSAPYGQVRDESFWNNRGKVYTELFNSLKNRAV